MRKPTGLNVNILSKLYRSAHARLTIFRCNFINSSFSIYYLLDLCPIIFVYTSTYINNQLYFYKNIYFITILMLNDYICINYNIRQNGETFQVKHSLRIIMSNLKINSKS